MKTQNLTFDRIRHFIFSKNHMTSWLQNYTQATWFLDHIAFRSERKRL